MFLIRNGYRVLRRNRNIRIRHDPEDGQSCDLLELQDSRSQDLIIASKLVDDKSPDKGSDVVWQQFNRPV